MAYQAFPGRESWSWRFGRRTFLDNFEFYGKFSF